MHNQPQALEMYQENQASSVPELNKAINIGLLPSAQQNTVRQDHEVKENVCILKPNEILWAELQSIFLNSSFVGGGKKGLNFIS